MAPAEPVAFVKAAASQGLPPRQQRNEGQCSLRQQRERMQGARSRLSVALNRFCQSEECTTCDGTTRPAGALQLVSMLVEGARHHVPAYSHCHSAEGKQPTPGDYSLSL